MEKTEQPNSSTETINVRAGLDGDIKEQQVNLSFAGTAEIDIPKGKVLVSGFAYWSPSSLCSSLLFSCRFSSLFFACLALCLCF